MPKKRQLPWTLVSLALASCVIVGVIAVSAGAADPSEGTVSTEQPTLAWQGKHYESALVPLPDTATPQAVCSAPSDEVCDHFDLTVDIDPSHWETNRGGVEVAISWESEENADFDLYVYDEAGNTVGFSATAGGTSERVFIEEASGVYQVRVLPWDVVDSGYVGGARVESRAVVTRGEVPTEPVFAEACSDGWAGVFPCENVDLESFLPKEAIGGGDLNDIWGWTDPQTGREYAVVGRSGGTSFVDVTKPQAPKYLGNLPSHQSVGGEPIETIWNTWHDVKVFKNHAFVVSEEPSHGLQVFDLTRLRGVSEEQQWTEDAHYSFALDGPASLLEPSTRETLNPPDNAHNIAINEDSGFVYAVGTSTCGGGGPHMVDVNKPKQPAFAGCVAEDGYTHDTQCVNYREGDPDPKFGGREICFNANEDTLTIVDVTDKENPEQLASVPYDGAAYTHQGWLTEDRRHFLVDDELDEQGEGGKTRTYIFNVEKLRNPTYVATHQGETESIDHNQYVKGDRSYQANYRSGLRVLDVSRVKSGILDEVGFFDVYPDDDGAEFNGAWSNYPYFDSGIVIVSGIEQGLFVLRPDTGGSDEKAAPPAGSPPKASPPNGSPPPAAGGNPPEQARSGKPRVKRKVRVNRKGRGRMAVKCPAQKPSASRTEVTEGARCKGKVVLRKKGKRIARKRFSVAAGERRVYRVRIARRMVKSSAGKKRKARAIVRGKRADGRKAKRRQRVVLVFAGR